MASTSMARICDLPDEVLLSIFSFLPVADLARCAATCERWHGIVTGFTHLWKGKDYSSTRSPTESAETRAVLHALPPLQKVTFERTNDFVLSISYPCLVLSDNYVTDLQDYPRLRCKWLSTPMHIVGDVMSFKSSIDIEGLQQLSLEQTLMPFSAPTDYCADFVVYNAMRLCTSLTHLSVVTTILTPEYLDEMPEFGRLKTLEIRCPELDKLSFLRPCSGTLEELHLFVCTGLPSRELSELSRLQNLQKLWLTYWRFEEGDLAAAMAGLANLKWLKLECCNLISNLSILHHCGQLRELYIAYSFRPERRVNVMPGEKYLQLHDLQLPTTTENPWGDLVGFAVTGDNLSVALSRLEDLGLNSTCRVYLSTMDHCSQLRKLSCDFESWSDDLDMLTVRIAEFRGGAYHVHRNTAQASADAHHHSTAAVAPALGQHPPKRPERLRSRPVMSRNIALTSAEDSQYCNPGDQLLKLLNMMCEHDNDLLLKAYEDTQPAIDSVKYHAYSPQPPAPQQNETSPQPEGSQYWPPSYEQSQAIPRSLQGEDSG